MVFRRTFVHVGALALLIGPPAALAAAPEAERVYLNAKVFTAKEDHPYADAVAVRGDKIVAVGAREHALKAVGASAARLAVQGRTLLPGLVDSHAHPSSGGLKLISAHLGEDVETVEQLAAFAAEATKSGRGMRGDILVVSGI